DALAIDDDQRRDGGDPVGLAHRARVVGDGVADLVRGGVARDEVERLLRDADDAEAARAVLLLPAGESRRGGVARPAPSGPELDEDYLAGERAERGRVRPLGIGEREGRRRPADEVLAQELDLVGTGLERERHGLGLAVAEDRERDLGADAFLLHLRD